ncbi:MAG TPA: response regulator, partial [Polyangiaceae bacterium]|nr:response regulator [Polyangiaceae bacterium]
AGAKILVADDDDGVRAGLAANLEVEGYQVVEAVDGGQALALIREQRFDLVISDVVMPVANGVEVLEYLKLESPETPLVLISAFVSETMVSRAVSRGLYTMLYKPVGMGDVLRIVDRALARRALLIVDDAEPYLASLSAALRSVGMLVEAAADGPSALAYAGQNRVDVCILDLVMSAPDGVETCQALRSIDRDMDIIAITGSSDPELVRRITRHGVAACLRKPFEINDLLSAIVKARGASSGRTT